MAAKKLCAMCAMYLQNVFYGDYSAQENQQTYVNVHLYYWNVSITFYRKLFTSKLKLSDLIAVTKSLTKYGKH